MADAVILNTLTHALSAVSGDAMTASVVGAAELALILVCVKQQNGLPCCQAAAPSRPSVSNSAHLHSQRTSGSSSESDILEPSKDDSMDSSEDSSESS
jgi:hypothetical protein